jgi:anti-sigma regulatory factor (Ser/Thr protein kinase)/CheY-like chemotaxis protein
MSAILVVESAPGWSKELCALLDTAGHTPRTAGVADAAAAIRELSPEVVLADLTADGLDLVKAVRKRHPSIPVLVVAEPGEEELAVDALRAGAANFISRRSLPRDLLPMLNELLVVFHSQVKRAVFLKRMTGVEYRFDLENDPDLIGGVVSQVDLVMEQMNLFDDADRMRVGVGVHEAVVNAMVHGNLEVGSDLKTDDWAAYHQAIAARAKQPPYRDRRVTVVVRAERKRELALRILDQGPGFDPSRLPDPTDAEALANGSGRGMLLIRTFFDEVRHNPTGNEITLVKRAGG